MQDPDLYDLVNSSEVYEETQEQVGGAHLTTIMESADLASLTLDRVIANDSSWDRVFRGIDWSNLTEIYQDSVRNSRRETESGSTILNGVGIDGVSFSVASSSSSTACSSILNGQCASSESSTSSDCSSILNGRRSPLASSEGSTSSDCSSILNGQRSDSFTCPPPGFSQTNSEESLEIETGAADINYIERGNENHGTSSTERAFIGKLPVEKRSPAGLDSAFVEAPVVAPVAAADDLDTVASELVNTLIPACQVLQRALFPISEHSHPDNPSFAANWNYVSTLESAEATHVATMNATRGSADTSETLKSVDPSDAQLSSFNESDEDLYSGPSPFQRGIPFRHNVQRLQMGQEAASAASTGYDQPISEDNRGKPRSVRDWSMKVGRKDGTWGVETRLSTSTNLLIDDIPRPCVPVGPLNKVEFFKDRVTWSHALHTRNEARLLEEFERGDVAALLIVPGRFNLRYFKIGKMSVQPLF